MKTVILHVGMHKTGTTSLQNSLHGLASGDVRYVDLGRPNHSIPIRAAFTQRADGSMLRVLQVRDPRQLEALRQQTLERLRSQLSLPGPSRFILSGEGICLLARPGVAALHGFLLQHVDRVQACAYVREPVGFSASAFQEQVKGGYAVYRVPQPKYRKKLEKFGHEFGADHLALRVFDRDKLRDGSVVADFCHLWGIPFNPRQEARVNESLSEAAVKLLHLFNRTRPLLHEEAAATRARLKMVGEIAAHFPGTFRLPPQFHADAFDPEDVGWLRDHCGIDFAAPGPVDPDAQQRDFKRYLEHIDPSVVASYRALLAGLGLPLRSTDTAAELLECHYRACERSTSPPWKRLAGLFRR